MGRKSTKAERSKAAAILGAMGGRAVTPRKRAHLKSIAGLGAKARWGTKRTKRTTKRGGR